MSSGLLSVGLQALTANQSALTYTGQNIANVNTDGYSRQRVNFATLQPPILGVTISDIQRITDEYLVKQVWTDQSSLSSSEQQVRKIELLDKLMMSEATNISTALDEYFLSMQSAVDDPLFIANRELFLSEAQSIVDSFQGFDERLSQQQSGINTEIRSLTNTVNGITSNIAQLNVKVSTLASGNQNYNSLIDERDNLIKELSRYMSIDVVSPDGGVTTNVVLSNGEPIVTSARASTLSARDGNPDPLKLDLFVTRGASESEVSGLLGTGALGGIFTYRDEVLQPVVNEIGRLAVVFSQTMNEQHRQGMDLNGDIGFDLFKEIKPTAPLASDDNRSENIRTDAVFYDVKELTGSDYEFEMTGLTSFKITRLADGRIFNSSAMSDISEDDDAETVSGSFKLEETGTTNRLTVNLDGFTLSFSGTERPRSGDTFLFQPTKVGARQMSLEINNPKLLALASPLRVTPATTNQGNAIVTSVNITDASDRSPLRPGQLDPPAQIRFNSDGTYSVFDVSDPSEPRAYRLNDGSEMLNLNYESGEPIVFDSFTVTLDDTPKAGDRFTIEYNTDGVSDNRNALALSDLQSALTVNGNSYQDAYGQLLARVGTQANAASVSFTANQAVLTASEQALQSIVGVNLDEEATKLVQYQQAYTAATRLISTYQTIFDSLLQAVR